MEPESLVANAIQALSQPVQSSHTVAISMSSSSSNSKLEAKADFSKSPVARLPGILQPTSQQTPLLVSATPVVAEVSFVVPGEYVVIIYLVLFC